MSVSTIEIQALFADLATGRTLVTGNSRLARVLRTQFGQWRVEQGQAQWQSPDILSWEAWLNRLWEAAGLQGVEGTQRAVPGSHQLLNLWERILRDDPRARQLLRPEALASRLRDTRKLAIQWKLDMNHPAWSGGDNENHSAFHHWNRAFETLCLEENWVPPEDRIELISVALRAGQKILTSDISLLGFDEFNPSQIGLLDALAESGIRTRQLALLPAETMACLWASRDSKDEMQKMARWVRHWAETAPNSTIVIVVPDLQARRQEVERHLAEYLLPGSAGIENPNKPWNTSLGIPLARLPMIETAFDLLRLLEKRIDIQDLGRVLRSPWLSGGLVERNSRALLEKCIRENYPRQLKLSEVWYRAGEIRKYDREHQELPVDQQEPQPWNSPILVSAINRLSRFERESRSLRSSSAWAEAFDGLLSGIGWPQGGGIESDAAWPIVQAWQDALRGLASLDATSQGMSRNTAISQLHQICREQVFQARTPPSNIQVLGLYEVSGLQFDHLWVLGLHNDNWPPAAQPNPFIPGMLQQQAQLPQSSPQRELEVARAITSRLLQTAGDCVFSFPGQIDGEAVLSSPLLADDAIRVVDHLPGWSEDNWQTRVHKEGPPVHDLLLMPGPPAPGTARGGSSILKHQALCPFRAFASNRLAAEGLETPVDGISPALHGSLVHRVLENFWRQTQSSHDLLALDATGLQERIRLHVEKVVGEERSLHERPEFRKVESHRLQRLVAAQLELEKTREPFRVVGFERELLHEIDGHQIRLIIDRIDQLESGAEAIIDYKTGKVQPGKWFGDRPDDPQLPLYASSAINPPAAVVFSVIRDDECVYKGIASAPGLFPGVPPRQGVNARKILEAGENMAATIDDWRQVLHRLMADFLAGEARIDPKDGDTTCKNSYCDLHSFCRIRELENTL
jgi:ATP-dependent helicase/nuclease subunit B